MSELRALLAERGIATSVSGLLRFFRRQAVTHKKLQATEQQRPDSKAEREDLFETQDELDLITTQFDRLTLSV